MRFDMVRVVTTVLFLMSMLALPESSYRVLPGEKQRMMKKKQLLAGPLQVQGRVPPISVPNPLTIDDSPPSTISQKVFAASDHINYVSPLRRQLLKAQVLPSAPNPGTYIPSSTTRNNAPPLLGSLQKSPPTPNEDTSIP